MEAILDATASSIAQDGLAGMTMHGVAQRAKTSIGSLYHFFPDRASLLLGLVSRHDTAIAAINSEVMEVSAEVWQQLSAADAINHLMTPYVDYVRAHPDYFLLMHDRRSLQNEERFTEGLRRLVNARLPKIKPAARGRHTAMLYAIAVGIMRVAFDVEPKQLGFYLRELPRVMSAYLADVESEAGASKK
ncbi:TetR/AcrR family transcriptional regulator [Paraburkholderia sp. HP33-1]|uniref:TetR/AcrR family transcriptional regulator n=1 Tax=Paraburkholderia sp. HP33-1 TaxID=2883243 RepID=UPI001F1FBC06|nr:TetR/AcrR family transcriptional regulator [Paraburkholderia sp. HP33-1]